MLSSEYAFLALFAAAGAIIVWRLFGLPRWRAAWERGRQAGWPRTELERLLVAAGEDPAADAEFVRQFLRSELLAPHAANDPQTPLTISARFHRKIVAELDPDAVVDGDYVVLGPWIWCFSTQQRVGELKQHPLYAFLAQAGLKPFPAIRLLQEAERKSTALMLNPMLPLRRTFSQEEIKQLLSASSS